MGAQVDAGKLDIFVLNCQLFRATIQRFAQNLLPCVHISQRSSNKNEIVAHIPLIMARLILDQYNDQPTIQLP
jgi:hypothetical protein